MVNLFNKLFRSGGVRGRPSLPPGRRVYAIGDIHGRLDLLSTLADAIDRDDRAAEEAETTIILLGDLVDRGPDSRGVLEFARNWSQLCDLRILLGNHEEMFLNAFYEKGVFRGFLRFGGVQTLASYGLDAEQMIDMDFPEIKHRLTRAVPKSDRVFMHSFEHSIRMGDYLFVHAGIHPKVPLDQQDDHDCRWIREPFLSHKGDLGCMVVHGHTVKAQPELCDHRIGIDTGAYESGLLTALRLEGTDRRLIQAEERDSGIGIRNVPANSAEDFELLVPESL